jgi:gliding motility-associated-like protein
MEATGIGTCKKVSDSLTVTINPAPTVDAGVGAEFCASVSSIDLDGSLTIATQGVWSTSGSGTFSDSSNLQARYFPSFSDKTLKTVTLTLTSTDNGLCNAVKGKVTYTFTPVPTVTIGNDQTVCKDATSIPLNGSVTNAQGGFWEAVGVTQPVFSPDNAQSITSYLLSPADTANNSMTFKYTSYGSGTCAPASKTMHVKLLPAPIVDAGNNQSVCSDVTQIQLAGSVRNAGGGSWQSSGNGVITNIGQGLTATYLPTADDISNGFVIFSLTSQNNNGCHAGNDTVRVTILQAPQIVSIPSASICADTAGVLLSPSILNEGTVLWTSTSGTGTFLPSAASKDITFIPSAEQIGNGQANLVLTVQGGGACSNSSVTSNTIIQISKAPSLSLSDISTCEGSATIDLSAVRDNDVATKFQWISLSPSPGTFSGSGQALSVTYSTSANEQLLTDSTIQIAFFTTEQGKCKPFRDTINVSFVPTPSVSAGDDQKICTNSDSLRLNASGSAGVWSRLGTGTGGIFKPSNTALNASYFPSVDDVSNNFIDLVFTSIPGGTCTPKSDTLHIDILPGPIAHPVPTTDTVVCSNAGPIALIANNSANTNVTWSSDGTGFFNNATSSNAIYTPSFADITSGQILFRLKVVDNGNNCIPTQSKFNLNFTPAPQVFAGNDADICANAPVIVLNGSVTKASIGNGIWSLVSPAAGFFGSNGATTSTKLDDVYIVNPSDITSGHVQLLLTSNNNGKCNAVSDTITFRFTPAPKVTVLGASAVCGDTSYVPLSGTITVAPNGQWTHNGQGFFTDSNQVITRYLPSDDERNNGAVINFTLNSQATGTCISESASFDLTITPKPVLKVGKGVVACGDTSFILLDGLVSNVGGGQWSVVFGSGKFQSNQKDTSSVLTDKYIPSNGDINSGQVLLKLTTTNNGQCKAISDFKSIALTPVPRINAGIDFQVCANNRQVPLQGHIIQVATGGKWSTNSTGQFLTSPDTLISSYLPSSADSASGSTTLFLTSTGNGACKPALDTLVVKITPAPTVNPGANMDTCADFASTTLHGNVQLALGELWTTDGTGIFSDPTALSTSYEPSEADKTNGIVHFTLASDGNGSCLAVKKTIQLTITPKPMVFAGNDTTVCSNVSAINLSGTKNATVQAVKWSSGGNGAFSQPANQLATGYSADSVDTNAGAVTFILESTQQGKCQPVQDVKVVSFQQAPKVIVSAGFPRTVCENNSALTLNGTALNTSKTVWRILSSPSFIESEFDDSLALVTDFQPVATGALPDTARITLSLTGYGIGTCTAVAVKDLLISILPKPKIDLGPDTLVACADKDTVYLNASIKIGNTPVSGFWTTTGTGVFEKNGFINNPVYRLSKDDRTKSQISFVFKSDGFGGCDTVFKAKVLKLIPSVPTSDAGPDQTICANNPIVQLHGQTSVASVFTWSNFPSGGSFSPVNTLITTYAATAPVVSTGAVKIKLTTHGPQNCKDVSDEMLAIFSPAPTVTIKADSIETCADNDSITLSADIQHAGGGLWTSSGSGQFLPDVSTLNAVYQPSLFDKQKGSVILRLTSTNVGNCLPVRDSVIVSIRKAPEPTASTKANLQCVSQTGIHLKGNSSTGSGFWASSGSGSFSPNANDSLAVYYPGFSDYAKGSVSLTFTTKDNKTCKPVSQAVLVNVNILPVADAGKDLKICIGTSTTISPINEPNLVNYSWLRLSPSTVKIDDKVFETGILNTKASYQLTVTDNKGCQNVDTMEVRVFNKPQLDYNTPYCAKDLIKAVTLPYDTIDGEFQWYVDGNIVNAQNRSTIQPPSKGMYTNIFTFYNCSVADSALVRPLPILNGVNQILCQNIQHDTIAMNFVPNNKGYTWSMTKFRSGITTPLSAKGNSFTQNIGSDTLIYYARVIDSTGICASTDSIIVFPIPSPQFAHLPDTIMCGGTSVTLNATPVNFSSTRIHYFWEGVETGPFYTVTVPANLTKTDTTEYHVRFDLGTCTVRDSARVIGHPLPMPNLPDKQYFCSYIPNSQDVYKVTLDAGSNGKILWSTGDTTRIIYTSKEGFYSVVVTNMFNCTNSDSTTLIEQCEPTVYIPNAFSPNGDNRNDVFRVFGNKFVKNFKLMVFSRWGEIIFYMEDIDGDNVFEVSNKVYSWDGNYKGQQMPIGVYEFIATYEGKDDQYKGPYKKTGSVEILR